MSTIEEKKRILKKRWRCTLTENQRMAWNVCACLLPITKGKKFGNQISGEEVFVNCNIDNIE